MEWNVQDCKHLPEQLFAKKNSEATAVENEVRSCIKEQRWDPSCIAPFLQSLCSTAPVHFPFQGIFSPHSLTLCASVNTVLVCAAEALFIHALFLKVVFLTRSISHHM